MDEKNLKSLYDFAVSNKLDIGDYASFKAGMAKPENRKSFHDFATQNKLDIGSYDDFEKNWSDVKKKENSDLLYPGSQYAGAPSIGDQKETDLFPQVAAHDKVPDVSQGLGYKYGKDKSIAPQTAIKPLKKGETQITGEQPEIEGYDEANKPIDDALRFAKNGDIKAANQILNVAATEKNPYSFELRSYTNEQLGNLTDAKKDLQLAYAYSPTRIDLLPKMGVLDMKTGDAKSAEKNADEYIKVTGGVSNKQRGIAANLATSYAIKSKTALSRQEQDEFAKKSEFWKANYDALEDERKINQDAHTLTSLPDYLMTSQYSGIGLLMTPTMMAKSGIDNISTGTPSGIIKGVADIAMLGGAMTPGGSAFFAGMNAAEIVTPQGASQVFMKPITSILQLPDVQHALGKPSPEMQNWVDVADLTVGLVLMGNVSKAAELPDYMENLNKRIAERQTTERKMGEKQQEFIETETMRSDAHAQNIINGLRGIVNRTPIKVAEGDAILNEVHSLSTDQVVSGVKLHEAFTDAKKTAKELDAWMDEQTQPFYRIGADLVSKDDYIKKVQELKDKGVTDFDARAVNDPATEQKAQEIFKPEVKTEVKPAEPKTEQPIYLADAKDAPANIKEVSDKGTRPTPEVEQALGKKLIGTDPKTGLKIYEVDGETVRGKVFPDFSMGGNSMAYPNFIPEGEVWIDRDYKGEGARKTTIAHEVKEYEEMKAGKPYSAETGGAHDAALKTENKVREGTEKPVEIVPDKTNNKDVTPDDFKKKGTEFYVNGNRFTSDGLQKGSENTITATNEGGGKTSFILSDQFLDRAVQETRIKRGFYEEVQSNTPKGTETPETPESVPEKGGKEPIQSAVEKYGWTAEKNENGDYELSNSKGKKVVTVKQKGNKYEFLDAGGNKLMDGNKDIAGATEKLLTDYYYAKEKPISETPQKGGKTETKVQKNAPKSVTPKSVTPEGVKGKVIEPKPEVNADLDAVAKELNLDEIDKDIYQTVKDLPENERADAVDKLVEDKYSRDENTITKLKETINRGEETYSANEQKIEDLKADDKLPEKTKKAKIAKLVRANKELDGKIKEYDDQLLQEKAKVDGGDLGNRKYMDEEDINNLVDRVNTRLETRKGVKA
jgi:hypothetical protein